MNDPIAPQADVESLSFDDAFAELGRVVAALEAGNQSLEETIGAYERAVALQGRCDRLLAAAELRVSQLMARADGSLVVTDAAPEESGN
ncbi:MAG TPA: exodeoxyribonuclease VII small subunit [Candidatus Limnocylindrales bacterium]